MSVLATHQQRVTKQSRENQKLDFTSHVVMIKRTRGPRLMQMKHMNIRRIIKIS